MLVLVPYYDIPERMRLRLGTYHVSFETSLLSNLYHVIKERGEIGVNLNRQSMSCRYGFLSAFGHLACKTSHDRDHKPTRGQGNRQARKPC